MAIQKAMATGTEKVMDWYDRNSTSPYYSVYEIISPTKKDLLFSCNDESADNARSILEENIRAFEQNGVNTLYALVLHPKQDKSGYITANTPAHAMLKFKPAEEQQILGAIQQDRQPGGYAYNAIMEKLNAMESRLNAKDALGDMEEEEQPAQPAIWEQLLANPEKIEMLVNLAVGVAGTLGTAFRGKTLVGVAGIPADNSEVLNIVNSLMNKGVTIDHLKKLDEMNTAKLKSLLLML
jgi:hypothetical protein